VRDESLERFARSRCSRSPPIFSSMRRPRHLAITYRKKGKEIFASLHRQSGKERETISPSMGSVSRSLFIDDIEAQGKTFPGNVSRESARNPRRSALFGDATIASRIPSIAKSGFTLNGLPYRKTKQTLHVNDTRACRACNESGTIVRLIFQFVTRTSGKRKRSPRRTEQFRPSLSPIRLLSRIIIDESKLPLQIR